MSTSVEKGRLRGASSSALPVAKSTREELLVLDARAELRPSDMVERKLTSLLHGTPLPISQMRVRGPSRYRWRS